MIIDRFNSVAKQLYMEEKLTIDEQIIAYKGKKARSGNITRKNPRHGNGRFMCFLVDADSYNL